MLKFKCRKPELKRILRYMYLQIVRANDSPPRVAAGAALGVFLGIFPTFGLGIVLAVFFAWLLRINKAAAFAGSLIMNPLTTPFFWALSAVVGGELIGADKELILEELRSGRIFKALGPAFYGYMLGNLLVSFILAGVAYIATLEILRRYKKV
ncbi:MAG: hypothetical protein A2044_01635 [Candidatus Firestonebacteria bacterium GWA2_43_8]|nr:MAG: hypothetical protein A2044_01635 [Candidatus Firestonebacteria bacterium GWA2_43_8]